jgi:hypothetical protein
MACKELVPKKIGPVKIPKNLRRMGDKALADPKVAGIVADAVAAAGSLVAARQIAEEVPGGASVARSAGSTHLVHGIADLIKRTLEEVVQARDKGGSTDRRGQEAAQKERCSGFSAERE